MPRRQRNPKARLGDRFTLTVEEEVAHGIVWSDYRWRVSRFLLPLAGSDPATAAAAIAQARAVEATLDREIGEPPHTLPSRPSWPSWEGTK